MRVLFSTTWLRIPQSQRLSPFPDWKKISWKLFNCQQLVSWRELLLSSSWGLECFSTTWKISHWPWEFTLSLDRPSHKVRQRTSVLCVLYLVLISSICGGAHRENSFLFYKSKLTNGKYLVNMVFESHSGFFSFLIVIIVLTSHS